MQAHTIPQREEGIYQWLENASLAGDIDELHRVFHEGSILQQSPRQPANNPLHIGAVHGHAEFVREILAHKPKFATVFSSQGLTALHLACANVHLMVVKELLRSNIGTEVCNVRHKDGLLPIRTSALTGSIPVMEELVGACLENVVQELTCLRDSILHLALKYKYFEAVKILVERLESDHELLSLMDPKNNTILHLTTARKQLQTVKFQLGIASTDVNATNRKGCTVLHVPLESPNEHVNLLSVEMILAAGGTVTKTTSVQPYQPTEPVTSNNPIVSKPNSTLTNWKRLHQLFLRFFWCTPKGPDKHKESRNTLMVEATLIATVTFRGGGLTPLEVLYN